MTDPITSIDSARQRLARLDGYLREDPSNNALLIDTFDTALSCGEWERAKHLLARGQAAEIDRDLGYAWRLREGDFWLAQQRYDEAREVLERLAQTSNPSAGLEEALLHNLAFIDLRLGRFEDCIARLAPVLEGPVAVAGSSGQQMTAATPTRALKQLWLRALHHDGQLTRAMDWSRLAENNRRLHPQAAGVASLIAIDASDFAAAQRWSAASLGDGPADTHPVEAMVAQASLALAARDVKRAIQFSDAALRRQPDEGRAWSARGFADLLAGNLISANAAFVRALSTMTKHIGTWHGLGWTQTLQNDLDAARLSFEEALTLDRNFAESQGGLAVVLALQQSRQDAEVHAALALRLDKACLSARYAQALLSGEVKNAADLQRLAKRLLGGLAAPLGGDMADLLPTGAAPRSERSRD